MFLDFLLHLDQHLLELVQTYDLGIYFLLFAIIFLETGVVILPFLPGDSLLFAAGTLAAAQALHISGLFFLFTVAAILGDTANYHTGRYAGQYMMRFVRPQHLEKTQRYYQKYGKKTIVLARFIPVVRTIAPFLAGIGKMPYTHFLSYNIFGGILWVSLFLFGGYFFGGLTVVKENFSVVIVFIMLISFVPLVYEYLKHHLQEQKAEPFPKA